MRLSKINSFHNTASYNQTASNRQSSKVFAANLKAASKARIITEKKGGWIRLYLLHTDGTRELLSEEIDTATSNLIKQLNTRR